MTSENIKTIGQLKYEERFLHAKSIHIFGWPFQILNDKSSEFIQNLKQKGWKAKNMEYGTVDPNQRLMRGDASDIQSVFLDFKYNFMLNQYLSDSAKDIFTRPEKHICEILEYTFDYEDTYTYVIECKNESKERKFHLPILSIELHVYHFGVGILFIEVLNDNGKDNGTCAAGIYEDMDDIKWINDYGRRIMLPFIPGDKDGKILCAEKLGIENGKISCCTDFRGMIGQLYECIEKQELTNQEILMRPASFLFALLNHDLNSCEPADDIKVKPFTDDRMFTMCLIRDKIESNRIMNSFGKDDKLDEYLYSIVYVDSDWASCQNQEMRKELFSKSLYTRWSDWGTLWGVTSYSMMCVTSADFSINDSVIRPFLIEYKYLLSLVLAQRMGIAKFSANAGDIVSGVDQKGTINRTQTKELIHLQEEYITFKNQMLILEASNQEQGIEIYRMLQQQLLVNEEQEILDEQLESLYEVTNVSHGNKIGILGIWLAAIPVVLEFRPEIVALIQKILASF